MKRVLFVILLFITSSVFPQKALMKGSYTIGGNIGYTNISPDDGSSIKSFYFNPNAGYFFMNYFYVGLGINYLYLSEKDHTSQIYGFGPSVSYYFTLGKINPFLGLGYSYNKTLDSGDNEENTTISTFRISGGGLFFVTDYFALQGSVSYSFNDINSSGNSESKEKNKVLSVRFGVRYFIY